MKTQDFSKPLICIASLKQNKPRKTENTQKNSSSLHQAKLCSLQVFHIKAMTDVKTKRSKS